MGQSPESTGRKQSGRFVAGQSGNPRGRPKGARHRSTIAIEMLLDGEAEGLTRKLIETALGGDVAALRACMDRLLPPRRDRPVRIDLPSLASPADAVQAMSTLLAAVGASELTPAEGSELARLVETFVKAVEAHDLQRRVEELERRAK